MMGVENGVESEQAKDDSSKALDEISKELLGRSELAQKMTNEGWTVLHCAILEGREEMATQILSVAPSLKDQATHGGLTPMALATKKRHELVIIRLLDMNCSLVVADQTGLFAAAFSGFSGGGPHLSSGSYSKQCQ